MEIPEARVFASRAQATVVVLVGMQECGKTSLIARIHQQFQTGPIGEFRFAGSRTLPRLEEINWLAMLESGAPSPQMERTSRQFDNSFLHLLVRRRESNIEAVDVLINDISGETFPDMIASESVCRKLNILRRADHIALLVDGKALAKRSQRYDQIAKAKNFLQRISQTGQLSEQTILHLITTKQDSLLNDEIPAETKEVLAKLESDITTSFGPRVANLRCWKLAARPYDGSMPTSETIRDLFTEWVTQTARYPVVSFEATGRLMPSRDFCRFGS